MISSYLQLPLTVFRNSSIADEPVFMLHFILQQGIFYFLKKKAIIWQDIVTN